ncbi:MAG: hypothetical protein AB1898_05255 [Acidobacteriota bacterium]
MMRKQVILLNCLLLCSAGLAGYRLKQQWHDFQGAHHLSQLVASQNPANSPNPAGDGPVQVPNYSAIVDNHLFTVDRNNIIPAEVPVEAPLAPKPILMGTMGIGEDQFALMVSEAPKASKEYRKIKVGESLDGYTLVRFLDQKVIMKAGGQEIEVRLNEPSKMVAREVGVAPQPGASQKVTTVATEGSSGAAAVNRPSAPSPTSVPVGTVVNGYRKKMVPSPFGPMEAWEAVK